LPVDSRQIVAHTAKAIAPALYVPMKLLSEGTGDRGGFRRNGKRNFISSFIAAGFVRK